MTTQSPTQSKDRRRAWATGTAALVAVVYVVSIVAHIRAAPLSSAVLLDVLSYTFWSSAFLLVGLIIAFHRPGNPIAWICIGFAGVWSLMILFDGLAAYASTHPGFISRPDVLVALAEPLWVPGVGLIAYLLLYFPDGHLPSPRWRPIVWLLTGTMAILTITGLFLPGIVQETEHLNPFGIAALEPFRSGAVAYGLIICLIGCVLASAVSVVVRYRGAGGVERLQLKWLMAAGIVAALAYALLFVWDDVDIQLVWVLIPIAIGLSMHRHRLYDIDRLLSRTVVYTIVVAGLLVVYIAVVYVIQEVLGAEGPIGVAASTLAAAALFNPLRKRVQDRVDRRFNRSGYDAMRVADSFAGGLRDETDAQHIVQGWLDVVAETMQPTGVGVWLREG